MRETVKVTENEKRREVVKKMILNQVDEE
jgi:hypothetical protein